MFSMVLMAALTTGTDMPDFGRRGRGGCCGGYGGMAYGGCYGGGYGRGYGGCYGGGYRVGYGGCYGGGYRMGYGGGYGACYGSGYRMGYGGCYGSGYGMGFGGCSGSGYGMGWGGSGMGWGGGYGGMAWGGASPWVGGAYVSSPMTASPMISNLGTTSLGYGNGAILNPGTTQSFYNGGAANLANEATVIVHLPENATLTVDGQPTHSRSSTRTFQSPPLEPGKTYTYTLRAEINRDGRFLTANKTIEIRAGQPTEVTMNFDNANANPQAERSNVPARTAPARTAPAQTAPAAPPVEEGAGDQITPVRPRRTPPIDSNPAPRSFPTPPRAH